MTLALQLVTYGSADTIPFLLESLARQTRREWKLFVYDAGSPSRECEALRRVWENSPIPADVEWGNDVGFAGGHNVLFGKHDCDAVLLLNPDAILAPDYVEVVLTALENDAQLGSVSGLVLRWVPGDGGQPKRTTLVDSAGLRRRPWGAVEDAYAGMDYSQIRPFPLLGVSGCVSMIRRDAATATHPQQLLFVGKIHTYKEDVELAYRLRRHGWKTRVVQEAFAWHRRALRPEHRWTRPIGRREAQSYQNHWRIARWHWRWYEWLNPLWIPYEAAKASWYLLRAPWVVLGGAREEKR